MEQKVDKAVLIKSLILSTSEPIVLRNMLHWNILSWDKDKWKEVLKYENLEFRIGENCSTDIPQWETITNIVHGNFSDIFKYSSEKRENWIYFDYKYLKHNLLHLEELRENISWKEFGLDDVKVDDCTLWIGSERAHTSLHVDTYGCNIVAQVYGRKLWVLFPPDTDLKATRIPYEESSIFSEYNMFSPDVKSMKDIEGCRKVVLNPGEVLIVPCRWWHYVENLEPAISINVWLPLPQDDKQRLKESVVQMFISQMTINMPDQIKNQMINPNMVTNMVAESPLHLFDIVDHCKKICSRDNNANAEPLTCSTIMNLQVHNINENIEAIHPLTEDEYTDFIASQAMRFSTHRQLKIDNNLDTVSNILKSVTDTDVITLIANKLLQIYICRYFFSAYLRIQTLVVLYQSKIFSCM